MTKEDKQAIEFYTGKEISFELDWTPEQKKTFEKTLGIDKEPSFEEHQIKIQTLLNLIQKQKKEIENLKKKKQDVKDRIEYYLVGNMSLDNFDTRNKELRKLEKMLGE